MKQIVLLIKIGAIIIIVLSKKFPGLICICHDCGCLMGQISLSDIYGESYVYCPLCKAQNTLEFNKKYDGVVKENGDKS